MAMLAEKKRRQKWSLNPRGKDWSDDQTKFGQRLLEKMGWSAGQGLGINKQGLTEMVKVKKKDDNKGLGFKENGEEWLKTTSDYNELLDQLASTVESERDAQTDVTSSLEDRSKKSKARVHYHKYTRGKDLSRYSEKDLASIIGLNLVKPKADGDIHMDYKANQINKGSSTEYFNGKISTKQNQAPEANINEDATNYENIKKEADCSDKICINSQNMREDDSKYNAEPNFEIEVSFKKSKKHTVDEMADYQLHNDVDLNKKRKSKKKMESLQNGIESDNKIGLEIIEQINQFENVKNSLGVYTDNKTIDKKKKKVKKRKNENSIKPEAEDPIRSPDEEKYEEDLMYDKLSKNKRKRKLINCELERIHNEIVKEDKIELETEEVNTQFKEGSNVSENIIKNEKVVKKNKKIKEIQTKVSIREQANNYIENPDETQEDDLTDCVYKDKLNDHTNIGDKAEDEVVSKKKKKKVQQIVQGSTEQLATMVSHTDNKTRHKKRKAQIEDKPVEDGENCLLKKRKVDEENSGKNVIKTKRENKISRLHFELNEAPPSKEQLSKHTKLEKKSKNQSTLKIEGNAHSKVSEDQFDVSRKAEKTLSVNDNKGSPSNNSSELLRAFGRNTRLKKNISHNPVKHITFETEEFMAFNQSKNSTSTETTIDENQWSNKIVKSLLPNIYVKPNIHNSNISLYIVNYEYRLLTSKVQQLNIPTKDVRIIIKDAKSISTKLRKKLKLLYKSKYYKSLLPADELAGIEASVTKLAAQLQPKIDLINGLLEIENQTKKLANEFPEGASYLLADSNNQDTDEAKPSYIDKKEELKGMTEKLKLLSENIAGTANSTPDNQEKFAGKKRTKMDSPYSKCNSKSNSLSEKDSAPFNSLQAKIEEKLKALSDQMKLLSEGKKSNGESNQGSSIKPIVFSKTSLRQGRGSQRDWANNRASYERIESTRSSYNGLRSGAEFRGQDIRSSWGMGFGLGQGVFGSRMRGRIVVRGRISKNNFDAKQYAEKCKTMNVLPEIAFKGVDLTCISGYAADKSKKTATESSNHKNKLETVDKCNSVTNEKVKTQPVKCS